MGKKIYAGNLSFTATTDEIKELFSKYGNVETVNLITDAHTRRAKGFGFVEMATEEDAKKAIESLNGSMFMERTLSVAEAKPQQPRERRGFERERGGGNFGGGFGGGRGTGRGRR